MNLEKLEKFQHWNKYICEFIISVRTKDGEDYEPSPVRSLLASFEPHLKKNSYSASIMNDLVFEKTRKVLLSKQKELKKKGKGKRPNASIALTSARLEPFHLILNQSVNPFAPSLFQKYRYWSHISLPCPHDLNAWNRLICSWEFAKKMCFEAIQAIFWSLSGYK